MRSEGHQRFVDDVTDTLLEHGERIVEASDEGLIAAAAAIDDLIEELERRRDSLVLAVISASAPDCGDPDCPMHGKAARATDNPNLN